MESFEFVQDRFWFLWLSLSGFLYLTLSVWFDLFYLFSLIFAKVPFFLIWPFNSARETIAWDSMKNLWKVSIVILLFLWQAPMFIAFYKQPSCWMNNLKRTGYRKLFVKVPWQKQYQAYWRKLFRQRPFVCVWGSCHFAPDFQINIKSRERVLVDESEGILFAGFLIRNNTVQVVHQKISKSWTVTFLDIWGELLCPRVLWFLLLLFLNNYIEIRRCYHVFDVFIYLGNHFAFVFWTKNRSRAYRELAIYWLVLNDLDLTLFKVADIV